MPTPVALAADVVRTAAPGYLADPVINPSTPREYLWSSELGLIRLRFASFAEKILPFAIATNYASNL